MEIRGRRWQEDAAGGGRVNAAAAVQAAQTRTLPERNSLLWTLFGPSDPDRNPVPPLRSVLFLYWCSLSVVLPPARRSFPGHFSDASDPAPEPSSLGVLGDFGAPVSAAQSRFFASVYRADLEGRVRTAQLLRTKTTFVDGKPDYAQNHPLDPNPHSLLIPSLYSFYKLDYFLEALKSLFDKYLFLMF